MAALLDFADTVEALGGRYITAEDVGTSSRDMSVIAERHRARRRPCPQPRRLRRPEPVHRTRRRGGDPRLLRAGLRLRRRCAGRTICVVGLGHVGSRVARRCARAGAELLLADVDRRKRRLAEQLGARWVSPDAGAGGRGRRARAVRARRRPQHRNRAQAALPGHRRRGQQPAGRGPHCRSARGPRHPLGARLRGQRGRPDQHRRRARTATTRPARAGGCAAIGDTLREIFDAADARPARPR